ncbi:hypothetical protein A4A49_53955 [Nicotiana attenuata]|uniref:Uncharacterized protein n=1 Tax=Nicotiana attenuata TaxID=49451 RepID=A0A1J6I839_NICAT|nr:hypothetical protein A4A49_53955 [Nicotiana attenuata]
MSASQFTATTLVNVGRHFSKFSKTKGKRCQFRKWDDDLLDPKIGDLISSLK